MYTEKLTTIRASLKRRKLDCLLVSQPDNRRYLSGYSAVDHGIEESSGLLLIPATGTPFLLTDSRFQLHAKKEAPDFEVVLYPQGLLVLLKKILPALGVKKLGFESHYTLHSFALSLEKTAKEMNIEPVPIKGLIERFRTVKTEKEIEKTRQSVRLNEEVFREIYSQLRPGISEQETALNIENAMMRKGAERPSFDTIVAGGPNGAKPHAVPSKRLLREGEPIVIDMGLILDGYCSDMTRTIVLGTPDARTVELFRLVRKAQLAGMAQLSAGVSAKEVDQAARKVIEQVGLGKNFSHGLGHGVGMAVHEAPSLNRRNRKKLRSGMIVTVEPGVYLPDWGGIRLENMVVVRDNGCENLNRDMTFLDI